MTVDRRMDRLERIEVQGGLGRPCPRPEGLPETPVSTWPDEAMELLTVSVAAAMARGFTRPLGWMETADLLAARDRLTVTGAAPGGGVVVQGEAP